MGIFKKLFGAMSGKKYRLNPNSSALTEKEQSALNIGAINSEQVMCYSNSLETGLSKNDLYNNLNNYYEIFDRESACEVLDNMLNRGDSICYESIKGFISGFSREVDDLALDDDEKINTYSFVNTIREATDDLTKYAYIRKPEDFNNISIIAWDKGRLVLVSRCAYELGYITREESWQYINSAYDKCHSTYHNWNDFSKAYIIGRAMRFGSNMSLYGIMDIAKGLLTDDDSPWKKYPL